MKFFHVAAPVVVGVVVGGAGALAEVVIAALAEVGVRSGIRVADGPAAQGHAVRPTEGQPLLGDLRTMVRYATAPRLGPRRPGVPAKPVVE